MQIDRAYFGPLLPYIEEEKITDIDYNGQDLWITTIDRDRYAVDREWVKKYLTPVFVEQFTTRMANLVSRQFHRRSPELEAETEELRITILHESVARNGRSISIRKTPPLIRMREKDLLQSGYATQEILTLLKNCVKAKMNITFCGMPGVGKTECIKFFSAFIPEGERVITIEDTLEIRYRATNPGKDCVEMRIDPEIFSYADAIKASLRMNPQWIMLSEVRSREVRYLLESWSTGVRGMTTLHTDDVRNVPDRILNMADSRGEALRMENDIYHALDVGVLIRCKKEADGSLRRCIDQVCFYLRTEGQNRIHMAVEDGKCTGVKFPSSLVRKFQREGIADPFLWEGSR